MLTKARVAIRRCEWPSRLGYYSVCNACASTRLKFMCRNSAAVWRTLVALHATREVLPSTAHHRPFDLYSNARLHRKTLLEIESTIAIRTKSCVESIARWPQLHLLVSPSARESVLLVGWYSRCASSITAELMDRRHSNQPGSHHIPADSISRRRARSYSQPVAGPTPGPSHRVRRRRRLSVTDSS